MEKRKTVVVTGASAGVGRAIARAFGEEGARVALLARGLEGLEAAREEIEASGGEAMTIPTDIADQVQVEAAAEHVERVWGPIDVWVNNAMVTVFSPFTEIDPDDYKRVTDVTYLGYVWGTMAALKRMKPRDHGTIVQVGSALSYRAIPLQSAYCGAKFAIRGFTDSIRSELIHDNSKVHITMVQLSAFNTPQFNWARNMMSRRPQPLPPIFQPEVAAKAVVWASRHRRRELWVGFPAIKSILGNRIVAPFVDRVLAKQAYQGQCTDEPAPRERSDNLYDPVSGDAGAHGRFDGQAKDSSWQLWMNINRSWLIGGAAAMLGGLLFARRMQKRDQGQPRSQIAYDTAQPSTAREHRNPYRARPEPPLPVNRTQPSIQ